MVVTKHFTAMSSGSGAASFHRTRARCISGLTKTQAEDVLDWLEANGYHRCEVSYVVAEGFVVHYQ